MGRLPNGALPAVDKGSGRVLEYPNPLPNSEFHSGISRGGGKDGDDTSRVSERLDPGHRHFSLLHWLYPSSLLPGASPLGGHSSSSLSPAQSDPFDQVLAAAAAATLHYKLEGTIAATSGTPRHNIKNNNARPTPREGGGGGHTSWYVFFLFL